jgi:hypothetical protein
MVRRRLNEIAPPGQLKRSTASLIRMIKMKRSQVPKKLVLIAVAILTFDW